MQGEAPAWQRLVPDEMPNRVVFDAEALKDAVARVQITARQVFGGGRAITIEPLEDGSVTLRSQPEAAEVFGDCSEVVGLIDGGLPWPIGLNSRFLLEAIEVMDADKFEVELADAPTKPVRIAHSGFTIMLMPLKPL
jgi:DNA polymerase III sliding clamp (beta) subunit (PCNA family)